MNALLVVHAAATFFLLGLIWFVQIVHYPLLGQVGSSSFRECQEFHLSRTGYVVAPAMLIEGASAAALVWRLPETVLVWFGLLLLLAIWSSTAVLQVPRHRILVAGFDASAHRHLVRWNWIRTIGWTLRGGVAATLMISGSVL